MLSPPRACLLSKGWVCSRRQQSLCRWLAPPSPLSRLLLETEAQQKCEAGQAETLAWRSLGQLPAGESDNDHWMFVLITDKIKKKEKEMATHTSILAWKVPWTEAPGRWQSMGSQRVRRTCIRNKIYPSKEKLLKNDHPVSPRMGRHKISFLGFQAFLQLNHDFQCEP